MVNLSHTSTLTDRAVVLGQRRGDGCLIVFRGRVLAAEEQRVDMREVAVPGEASIDRGLHAQVVGTKAAKDILCRLRLVMGGVLKHGIVVIAEVVLRAGTELLLERLERRLSVGDRQGAVLEQRLRVEMAEAGEVGRRDAIAGRGRSERAEAVGRLALVAMSEGVLRKGGLGVGGVRLKCVAGETRGEVVERCRLIERNIRARVVPMDAQASTLFRARAAVCEFVVFLLIGAVVVRTSLPAPIERWVP